MDERAAAIEHLAELTKVAPELEPVWLHLAAALRENGEFDAATEVLFGAARAHPHWIRTARALAAASQTLTLDPEAVIRVVAISARRTNDPDVIMDLAQLWLERGDHAAATAVLEVLDTLGGDSARRHLIRGQLAASTGLRERATAEFCRALERDPNLEAAQTGLAELLRHAG